MILTASQSINCQCVTVIVGGRVFIWQCMVFILHKHWRWLNNGGWICGFYHGKKFGLYQRLVVGAFGGCWQMAGLNCIYIYIYIYWEHCVKFELFYHLMTFRGDLYLYNLTELAFSDKNISCISIYIRRLSLTR